MAINIPIVTEFVDQGLKSAQGAFDTFKTKVGEAEGGMGKLKAGSQVAFDSIKANAGNLALGAGAAIAGFAAKAIGDFKDLALAVDNFSDRTQLTLDQSSRWNEFTGDLGIEADAMIKIFDKLGKGASDQIPAFEELGVEIAFGPNGATDIEETFLRVVDKLNSLEDPADRAKLSAQLLGKGWQDAAEIINMQSDDIRKSLDAVGGQKLIDEKDIENAKNLREAQDKLNDAIEEFTLVVGQKLIPAFATIIDAAAPVVDFLGKFNSKFDFWDVTAVGIIENVASKMSGWFGDPGLQDMIDRMEALEDQTIRTIDPTDDLAVAWEGGYRAMIDAAGAADGLEESLMDVDTALAELKGEVDDRTAWRNLQDEFDNVVEAAVQAFTEGTPAAIRDSEQALDDLRVELAEYIVEADNIPTEVKTQFLAEIPTADLDRLNAMLDQVGRSRTVSFIPVIEQARENAGTGSGMGSGRRSLSLNPTSTGNVNVTVMGSVVTEGDLVNKVRKGLIDAQRNGAQLVYTNS